MKYKDAIYIGYCNWCYRFEKEYLILYSSEFGNYVETTYKYYSYNDYRKLSNYDHNKYYDWIPFIDIPNHIPIEQHIKYLFKIWEKNKDEIKKS